MSDSQAQQTPAEGTSRPWRVLAALLFGTLVFVGAYGWRTQLPAGFARVVFWPVTLLIKAAGTGPNIGTAERPTYEWTPVHLLALGLGLALSWLFYVLVAYSVLRWTEWWRIRPRALP
jgi:hypothetical protein